MCQGVVNFKLLCKWLWAPSGTVAPPKAKNNNSQQVTVFYFSFTNNIYRV